MAIISFIAVFAGWLVQGFLGIGSGIISTAILLLFYDAKTVVVSLSIIALIGTIYLAVLNFKGRLFLKEISILVLFSFLGAGIGSYLLEIVSHKFIEFTFGLVVIATGLYDLFAQKRKIYIPKKYKHIFASITGFIGGIISGLIGGSGPLYAFYLNQTFHDKENFKFVISFFFAILNVERIIFYLLSPLKNYFNMEIILPSILAVFLGAYLGNYIAKVFPTKTFKELVSFSIIIFGVYFLYKGF